MSRIGVMIRFLFLIIFVFSGCSQLKVKNPEPVRFPANANSCSDLVREVFEKSNSNSKITLFKLEQQGKISLDDLSILEDELIKNAIKENPNPDQFKTSLVLIKKKYAHFESEQLLKHYQFLEKHCGL